MTYKVYKSESAKMSENIACFRIRRKKMEAKSCKLLVNSILALVTHCSCRGYFMTTTEWE